MAAITHDIATVSGVFCRVWSLNMSSWMDVSCLSCTL